MTVILFIIFYIAANIYIARETYKWLRTFGKPFKSSAAAIIFALVWAVPAISVFAAYLLPASQIKSITAKTSNYYEGFLINTAVVLITAYIAGFVSRIFKITPKGFYKEEKHKKICGCICAFMTAVLSVYGFINANCIQITNYDINIGKKGEDMKIALVSDLHMGYSIGVDNIREMAEKINGENPDLVCIAGDIFDNDFDAINDAQGITEALSSIKSRYGTYACWGNHDISDKLFGGFTVNEDEEKRHDERMETLLSDAGIKLLEDETEVIDDKFTLIGRLDYHKPATPDNERKSIDDFEFDKSKLVIDMDHEPKELKEKADAGVDIDLGGHTHNGQIFPGTLIIKLFWENAAGCITKIGDDGNVMHSIVTEGVGVYGPFMRTGCKSEIAIINVHFTE